jgi:hypothetical protein
MKRKLAAYSPQQNVIQKRQGADGNPDARNLERGE